MVPESDVERVANQLAAAAGRASSRTTGSAQAIAFEQGKASGYRMALLVLLANVDLPDRGKPGCDGLCEGSWSDEEQREVHPLEGPAGRLRVDGPGSATSTITAA